VNRIPFVLEDAPADPLRGDVYLPDRPRAAPVIVACHGFKGFKDWGFWPEAGRRFAEAGLVLVTFNLSGSGIGEDLETFTELDRFEANTISKELADLGAILDAVARRGIPLEGADPRRLGLLGHSRGGGVVLLRAGRDPRVRSIVTWSAVSTFHRYREEDLERWRADGYLEILNARTGQVMRVGVGLLEDLESHGDAYEPVDAVRRLRVPLLLLHGTKDESVPAEDAQRLARAAYPGTAKLVLLEGAGHTFGATHPFGAMTGDLERLLDKTTSWFLSTLR
jgi:dipeptidyl aminopeptidase/acylaminoacyl peptidase